jgi:hypothetical protein
MSTRATIYHTSNTHIYEETSEPQYIINPTTGIPEFKGWNIEMCIGTPDMKELAIKDGLLTLKTQGKLQKQFPEFTLKYNDTLEIAYDCDGFYITLRGGSYSAIQLLNKPQ